MPLTYSRISNLVLKLFFFFWSTGALDFCVVSHPCPYRHAVAQMDKHELSTWHSILVAFYHQFIHLCKSMVVGA